MCAMIVERLLWMMQNWDCTTMQCSYILNSVRFRTDSNSVRKTNLKKFNKIFRTELDSVRKQKTIFKPRKNSEPNPIWFGKIVAIFKRKKILNRILFGSEKFAVHILEKMTHLLICSSAHLFICSSDHSNIDMISQLLEEQRHESESENV